MHTPTTVQYFYGYLMRKNEDVPTSSSVGDGLNRVIKPTKHDQSCSSILQSATSSGRSLVRGLVINKRNIKITTGTPSSEIDFSIARVKAEAKKDFRDPCEINKLINQIFTDISEIGEAQWIQLMEINIHACWEAEDFKNAYNLIEQVEGKGISLSREIMLIKIKVTEEFDLMDEAEKLYKLLCENYSQEKKIAVMNYKMLASFYTKKGGNENYRTANDIYDFIEERYCDGKLEKSKSLELGRAQLYITMGGDKNQRRALAIYENMRNQFIQYYNDENYRNADIEVANGYLCLLMGDSDYLDDALKHLVLVKKFRAKLHGNYKCFRLNKHVDQVVAKIYQSKSSPESLAEAERIYISLIERFENRNRTRLCNNHRTMLGLADVYIDGGRWSDFDKLNLFNRGMKGVNDQTHLCFAVRYFEECISLHVDESNTSRTLIEAIKHAHKSIMYSKGLNAEALSLLAFCAQIAACDPEMLISSNEFILCLEVSNKLCSNELVANKSIIKKLALEILIVDTMSWKNGDRLKPEYLNKFAFLFSLYADKIDSDKTKRPRLNSWNIRVPLLKAALPEVKSKYSLW